MAPPPGRGRATITQVAQLAAMAVSTAARVLNGRGRVNPSLWERVLAVASELGYLPRDLAQALRRGRPRILSLQVVCVMPSTSAAVAEGALNRAYACEYAVTALGELRRLYFDTHTLVTRAPILRRMRRECALASLKKILGNRPDHQTDDIPN
ncbi:MAG: LacI family DNA-binding transcriptional regulator [Chloroflexota bacterium]